MRPAAGYLTLHSGAHDFHASVPLEAVRRTGRSDLRVGRRAATGRPRGPVPLPGDVDAAACKTAEVDECVNVKYVDRLELSAERRFDNRPTDDRATRRCTPSRVSSSRGLF